MVENAVWDDYLWVSARKVVNFCVATFFFLSAYHTKPYVQIKSDGVWSYFLHRFKRLLWPYVLWSVIYVFVLPFLRTGNVADNWGYLLLTGNGPLYFLLALSQFTLLAPFLQRYKHHPLANILFWSVTPCYLLMYYVYNFWMGTEFKPEQVFCFPWFAAYYLGLKLQERSSGQLNKLFSNPLPLIFLLMLALLVSQIEGMWIYQRTGILSFAISQITCGSVLYSLCVILLVFSGLGHGHSDKSFLSQLGDYSMGIFLIHPFWNWIYKFVVFHVSFTLRLYETATGYMLLHILILVMSLISSYYTANGLSAKFPKLNMYLGLR